MRQQAWNFDANMSFPPFRVLEAAESLCLCSHHIQILPQEHVDRNHARARPACAVDLHHLWPDISPMFLLIPPWTLNLQDKASTPRYRNFVACGTPQRAHLLPGIAHIVPVHTTIREPFRPSNHDATCVL